MHDAYARGGECPLCTLVLGAEEAYLRSFQHSRVMEPSVRVKTNTTGFCPPHYRRLYDGENKLGLSLVEGLEAALEGKAPTDHVSVNVTPKQAYGVRDDSIVFSLPRAQFRGVDELEHGHVHEGSFEHSH